MHRYAVGMLDKATGQMQAMNTEAGRIIRMEPRCPGVVYEDTGAGVRSEPLDAETRMKEYKRYSLLSHSPGLLYCGNSYLYNPMYICCVYICVCL